MHRFWQRASAASLGLLLSAIAGIAGTAFAEEQHWNDQPFRIDLLSLAETPLTMSTSGTARSVAEDTSVRLRAFALYSQASAAIDFDSQFGVIDAINNVDLEKTLGMDMDSLNGGALVGFNFGSEKQFHLDLTYWGYYQYDGTRDVGNLIFDGELFTGEVKSEAQLLEGDVTFRWDFWKPSNFTVSFVGGINTYYVKAQIEEVNTGKDGSVSLLAPIPVLGASVRWDITPNLFLRGSAGGIYAGSYGNYYDLSAEVGYDFNRSFGLFVGYRFWDLTVDWDSDEYDVDLGAFYGGAELRF